jgi:hypothetical protein
MKELRITVLYLGKDLRYNGEYITKVSKMYAYDLYVSLHILSQEEKKEHRK